LILDRYLDAIDGARSYFFASDIAEFEKYRTNSTMPSRPATSSRRS